MSNLNVVLNRNKYIGGSDLPNILGFNVKYGKSIYDFAREKAGIIPNDFKGNEYTKYGQLLEPVIRDYINSINQANYKEDTIIDEARAYRGNTDGIDRECEIPILEVKTFGEELDIDYYNPQIQFYLETFNQPRARLIGYKRPDDFYTGVSYELEFTDEYFNRDFDESRIVEYIIERDKNAWAKIEAQIKKFKGAIDILKINSDLSEDDFNEYWYGKDLIAKCNTLAELEKSMLTYKDYEKKHKDIREELYKIFDDRGIISFDTGAIKITKVSPTSYDTISVNANKLQEDYPDLYDKYKVIKTTNRKGYILITAKKEAKING